MEIKKIADLRKIVSTREILFHYFFNRTVDCLNHKYLNKLKVIKVLKLNTSEDRKQLFLKIPLSSGQLEVFVALSLADSTYGLKSPRPNTNLALLFWKSSRF